MTTSIIMLNYNHQPLEALQMGGQIWLRGDQIDAPLGFANTRSVRVLYNRHSEEFTNDETRVVHLPSAGGAQEVRVFSLRGTRLLALLARTPEAKAFRRWVLDLLDGRVRRVPPPLKAVSSEAWAMIQDIAEWPDMPETVRQRMLSIASTGEGLPRMARVTALAEEALAASQAAAPLMKIINDVYRQGEAEGFSKDTLKLEMRLLKRLRAQPELPLADGGV